MPEELDLEPTYPVCAPAATRANNGPKLIKEESR